MRIINIKTFSALVFITGLLTTLNTASLSLAETLANMKLDKCEITLENTAQANNYHLRFQCDEPYFQNPQAATAFTLENPSRLVIDVSGVQLTAKQTIPLTSDELSSLRLAVNEGKTRTVVDIKIPIRPLYSISKSFDGKSLDINFALKVSTENLTNATGIKYHEDIKGDETIKNPPKSETLSPESSTVIIEQKSKSKYDGRTELKAVLFKSIGIPPRGGALFDLKSVDRYTLTKENDKRYRLVIEDTRLGSDALLLPQYAPQSVDGLEIILLREEGTKVIATIYVKDKTTLAPYLVSGKLWVKVSN